MHGTKSLDDPPPANAITQIPAGGIVDFEIVSNKAFSSMGYQGRVWVEVLLDKSFDLYSIVNQFLISSTLHKYLWFNNK